MSTEAGLPLCARLERGPARGEASAQSEAIASIGGRRGATVTEWVDVANLILEPFFSWATAFFASPVGLLLAALVSVLGAAATQVPKLVRAFLEWRAKQAEDAAQAERDQQQRQGLAHLEALTRHHLGSAEDQASLTLREVNDRVKSLAASPFGRTEVLGSLDAFVEGEDRGLLVLTAPSGMGKSTVMAAFANRRTAARDTVVSHFFHRLHGRTTALLDAYRALLAQLRAAGFDVGGSGATVPELHASLYGVFAQDVRSSGRLVVVLDALDEADALVPPPDAALGRGVYLVVSARATQRPWPPHVAEWLSPSRAPVHLALPLLTAEATTTWLADVLDLPPAIEAGLAQRLHATTEGVPLFLDYVLQDLVTAHAGGMAPEALVEQLEDLPAPFTGYAEQQLRRLARRGEAWLEFEQPLFAALVLAYAPLTVVELAPVLHGRDDRDIRRAVQRQLEGLVPEVRRWLARHRRADGTTAWSFAHPRLAEIFRVALPAAGGGDSLHDARAALVAYGRRWAEPEAAYARAFFPSHLLDAGCVDEAEGVLTTPRFVLARAAAPNLSGAFQQTLRDLDRALEAGGAARLGTWRSFFASVEAAVVRNSLPDTALPDTALAGERVLAQLLWEYTAALGLERAPPLEVTWAQPRPAHALPSVWRVLTGHTSWVTGAQVLDDGRVLSWSVEGTLRWGGPEGTPGPVLEGHTEEVWGAQVLDDGRVLSWGSDGTLRWWEPEGTPGPVLEGHTEGVVGAQVLDDGRVLSWGDDGTLRWWGPGGTPGPVLEGHTDGVRSAQVLDDGRVLSWSEDKTLRWWGPDGRLDEAWLEPFVGSLRVLIIGNGKLVAQGTEEELNALMDQAKLAVKLLVTVRDPNGDFASWLGDNDLVVSSEIQPARPGMVTALIEMEGDQREDLLLQVAKAGYGLRLVREPEDELEEIFLGLTQQEAA